MSVSYVTFLKHASKMTKGVSKVRPILQGVCHFTDGSIAVTDSHRLYYAEKAYETTEQVVKCPKTGRSIEGNYPDIKRLLPTKDGIMFEVQLNVADTHKALKAMLLVGKDIQIKMTVLSHDLIMQAETQSMQVLFNAGGLHSKKTIEDVKAFISAKYLYEAIDFFKDLENPNVLLKFYGNIRPMTISVPGGAMALLLPIRRPETKGGK